MTPYVVTSYDPLTRAAQLLLIDRIRCPSLLGQKYWENYPTFSRGCSIIKKILHVHIAQSEKQPVKFYLKMVHGCPLFKKFYIHLVKFPLCRLWRSITMKIWKSTLKDNCRSQNNIYAQIRV